MGMEGIHRPVAESRVHTPGPVGRAHQLIDHYTQRLGQSLTAELGIMRQRWPAALNKTLVGLLESIRGGHYAVLPLTALLVTDAIQRCQFLLGKLGPLDQNRINHVGRCVLTARQVGVMLLKIEQLIQHETDITQGGYIFRHRVLRKMLSSQVFNSRHPRP